MKKFKISISVRWKLTGLLVAFTAVVIGLVTWLVRGEVSATLDREIKERGLALVRNLASACVDPMEVSEEKTLALMLLVRDYVQTGGDENSRRQMFENRTMAGMILDGLQGLGKAESAAGVRNEGVLSVAVVDSATVIIACADAILPQDQCMERLGQSFVPEPETGFLQDGQDSGIWMSKARNGEFVIAVPIVKRQAAAEAGLPAEESGQAAAGDETGVVAPEPPRQTVYGAVYLCMTQSLVTRKVAQAVANLLILAAVVLLVGMLVTVWIGGLLAHPIRLLQRGVNAIAEGDFEQKVHLRRMWRDELHELTDAFNEMARGLKERELMRGAFSTYVSQDLLAEIIKNPEAMKVGGARRNATAMFTFFADREKFVAATERMEPEFVVRLINAYLELQAKMVREHGGYLDKFVGEEAMAVFGIPTERADHAKAAVRCAVDIKKALDELNRARTKQGLITTLVSIGLNSGPLVAGNIGSSGSKIDYTVIGDTVNTAARLGQKAAGGQVLISEVTYELVRREVEARELEPVKLRGKTEPVRVFEVLGMKGAASAGGGGPA